MMSVNKIENPISVHRIVIWKKLKYVFIAFFQKPYLNLKYLRKLLSNFYKRIDSFYLLNLHIIVRTIYVTN